VTRSLIHDSTRASRAAAAAAAAADCSARAFQQAVDLQLTATCAPYNPHLCPLLLPDYSSTEEWAGAVGELQGAVQGGSLQPGDITAELIQRCLRTQVSAEVLTQRCNATSSLFLPVQGTNALPTCQSCTTDDHMLAAPIRISAPPATWPPCTDMWKSQPQALPWMHWTWLYHGPAQ
jgi:hypothetical protein